MVELAVCGEPDASSARRAPRAERVASDDLGAACPTHPGPRTLSRCCCAGMSAYAPATAPRPPARAPAARMATTVFIDGQAGTTGLQVRAASSGAATSS